MEKILISACLLGEPVRYDGRSASLDSPLLEQWRREERLVPICPEVLGGLSTPRAPAELSGGDGEAFWSGHARVIAREGQNVSENFRAGAGETLEIARLTGCRIAILKARSPSCAVEQTYDGRFAGELVAGSGVTAALLARDGIALFEETQLDAAADWLEQLEHEHR